MAEVERGKVKQRVMVHAVRPTVLGRVALVGSPRRLRERERKEALEIAKRFDVGASVEGAQVCGKGLESRV